MRALTLPSGTTGAESVGASPFQPFRPFTSLLSGMIALLSALAIFPRGALPGAACAPHKTSACLTKSWILILLFCPSCVCMGSSSGMKGGCAESVSCFGHSLVISPSTAKMIRSLSGFTGFAQVGRCLHAFIHVASSWRFVLSVVVLSHLRASVCPCLEGSVLRSCSSGSFLLLSPSS